MGFEVSLLHNRVEETFQGELQGTGGPPQICVGAVFPQGALQHNGHETQLSEN